MPRYVPASERLNPLAFQYLDEDGEERSPDADAVSRHVNTAWAAERSRCTPTAPYTPRCNHSWFRDLLVISDENQRRDRATESVILRGRPDPATDASDHDLDEAKQRLDVVRFYPSAGERRDLSQSSIAHGVKPSMPGYLAEIWGKASRATGTLSNVFESVPLEPGMVDTSSGVPVVSIPRLSGGSSAAVQASQNAAVSETDPTSAAMASPVASIAGQVDLSRQLFEFSQPGFDAVLTDDLGRAIGAVSDAEIVNGSAGSGRTRGLLNWSGILSVTGTVTNTQTFLNSVWQGYSALSYGSGYGTASTDDYVVIVHPRRLAWLNAGVSGVMPPGSPLPGQIVASAGIPTTLGAGTNEDVALIVEKSNVVLLSDGPKIRVFEEVGSETLTVRVQAQRNLAVLVKSAAGIAKVTGLTPPSGF